MMFMELELRFYSLDEIAAVLGRDKSASQFARDTKAHLKREGYTYEWFNRKGVQIISREVPPQLKLKKLLVERLGLDPQVDPLDFARFIVALCLIGGFDSAPYATKERVLFELLGKDVSNSTLRRWAGKLYETENAHRWKRGALWKTVTDKYGMKRQSRVPEGGPEYKEYCDALTAAIHAFEQEDAKAIAEGRKPHKTKPFGRAIRSLYSQHGRYYWCPQIVLNALGDDVDEIIDLVFQLISEEERERFTQYQID